MHSPRLVLPFLVAVLASPVVVYAAPCGDNVDGQRIACRCGDTVVSNTTLRIDDPVVRTRCELDGLTVRAGAEAESIRLDLGGFEIHGSGVGVGIRVAYGGADGAWLVGGPPGTRGVVAEFGTGLSNTWREALARVVRLELSDNRGEGARVTIAGTVFEDVTAHGNLRDGLYLHGTGGRLVAVRSYGNGENGIRLFTSNAAVDAVAEDNGRSGIIVDGDDNDLGKAEAAGNGRDGILVRAAGKPPAITRSEANLRDDLRVNGRRIDPQGAAR